jgi:catechol 2,3-dioxygenase-like lactoylglutathione lyase family enzyme
MPSVTGIAHVELSVSDLDRSVAWYAALLDASEVFRAADPAEAIVAAALREPSSGMIIAFTEHERQEGGRFTPRRTGLDHLCFAVPTEDELAAWEVKLDALGIAHSPVRDYGYGYAITFADPDGIALELMVSRPRRG